MMRRLVVGTSMTTALVLATVFHQAWLPELATALDIGQPPEPSRFVLVLGGNSEIRPFVAAELIKLGFADQALIPRQKPSPDVIDGILPSAEEIEAAVFRYCGVAEDRIGYLEGEHLSTFDEAHSLQTLLEQDPAATALVVTNAFHSRRARWTFRTVLGEQASRVHYVSAPNPTFRSATWWRTADGTKCIVSEYLKLLVYWLRYGRGLWWVVALIGAGSACYIGRQAWKAGRNNNATSARAGRSVGS